MFSVGSVESAIGATSSVPALTAPWPERLENSHSFRTVNLGGSTCCTLQTNAGRSSSPFWSFPSAASGASRAGEPQLGELRQSHHDIVSVRPDRLVDDRAPPRSILRLGRGRARKAHQSAHPRCSARRVLECLARSPIIPRGTCACDRTFRRPASEPGKGSGSSDFSAPKTATALWFGWLGGPPGYRGSVGASCRRMLRRVGRLAGGFDAICLGWGLAGAAGSVFTVAAWPFVVGASAGVT